MLRVSLKTAARKMVVGENCIMGIIVWEYCLEMVVGKFEVVENTNLGFLLKNECTLLKNHGRHSIILV